MPLTARVGLDNFYFHELLTQAQNRKIEYRNENRSSQIRDSWRFQGPTVGTEVGGHPEGTRLSVVNMSEWLSLEARYETLLPWR